MWIQYSSVAQLFWLFAIAWTAAQQASLSITNSRSLPKSMSIESVMPSNHLILCRPLLPHLQSFSTSGSFPMSQFFTSGGQGIGASASASVVPINSQGWFPLELASPFFLNCIFCLFIYLLHHTACGILVPQPGIELGPSAVRVQSSNHWTTREFPASHIQLSFLQLYKDQVSYLVRFCF